MRNKWDNMGDGHHERVLWYFEIQNGRKSMESSSVGEVEGYTRIAPQSQNLPLARQLFVWGSRIA